MGKALIKKSLESLTWIPTLFLSCSMSHEPSIPWSLEFLLSYINVVNIIST